MISANTFIQTNSDVAIRGRIMGVYLFIFMGGTPIGSPVIGYVAEHLGPRLTIAGCGLITMLATLISMARLRSSAKIPADITVAGVLRS